MVVKFKSDVVVATLITANSQNDTNNFLESFSLNDSIYVKIKKLLQKYNYELPKNERVNYQNFLKTYREAKNVLNVSSLINKKRIQQFSENINVATVKDQLLVQSNSLQPLADTYHFLAKLLLQ